MSRRPRSRLTRSARSLPIVAILLLLLVWSCDSADQAGPKQQASGGGGPCSGLDCGDPCAGDGDCPSGTYCGPDNTCTADCVPGDARCDGDQVCDDRGRCGFGINQGGFGGGNTGGGNVGGDCGSVDVAFEPIIPTIMLLVDQSGSMTSNFDGQPRWDVVYDALMDPVEGVVMALQEHVRFALALYTYSGGGTCPELVEVTPPALLNHAAIDAVYAPEVPLSNTPTGDSITAITPELDAFAEPGPKLIILATDGNPDRCEDPSGHDQISMDEATDAAQAAYALGISTTIIAVGDQVSQQHQQDMANAGSGRPVPAPSPCDPVADPVNCAQTYEPTTKQALIDALTEIILGQRSCVFTLDGSVIAGKECEGEVLLNGQPIGCNDPDGWQLNSPTEIEFVGAACDLIMNEPNIDIEASFPCDAVEPPPS